MTSHYTKQRELSFRFGARTVRLVLSAPDGFSLEYLNSFFAPANPQDKPQDTFHFEIAPIARPRFRIRLPIIKSYCKVYWTPSGRLIEYENGSVALLNFRRRHAIIGGAKAEWIAEEILAAWGGLCAEAQGAARIHGVAFGGPRQASLLHGASGFGKSTLALRLIQSGIPVHGEEVVFVSKRQVEPDLQCLRLKESPEQELEVPLLTRGGLRFLVFSTAPSAEPTALDSIIVGQSTRRKELELAPLTFPQKIKWAASVGLGIGLPQMTELSLGVSTAGQWVRAALSRIRFVISFWPVVNYALYLPKQNRADAQVIHQLLLNPKAPGFRAKERHEIA